MNRSVRLWQWLGFGVTSLFGTLLHFVYEWLGEAAWIAPIAGINESTWEHMKLLFWPMLLFAAVQSLFFRSREDFWCIKLCGILLGLGLIPVLFYTYNGVVGMSPDWINVVIFFLSAAAVYIYEARRLQGGTKRCNSRLAIALLCAIALLFVVFTFATPEIGIFEDPSTGTYGI